MDTHKRPGGRSARVREAVFRAALLELGETGWGSLNVEQLADRSGVHKTTIYRRWGSANQVALEALLDRGSEGIPVPDTGDVTADLIALGRSISTTISEPIGRSIAAAAIEAPDSSSIREVANAFWSERFDQAGLVVMRAIERGQLPVGADPRSVIERVAGPIWFRVMVSRLPVTDSWLADVVEGAASTARNRPRSSERDLNDS